MFIVIGQGSYMEELMLDDIRVLLVDDENAFTSVLAKRLARRGLSVATASGGSEAYALLENSVF